MKDPVPLPAAPRAETLKTINEILAQHGIPPWKEENIGALSEGKPQIEDVTDYKEIGPGRVELEFRMLIPGGGEERVRLRFGGRLVYVIPILNFTHGNDELRGLNAGLLRRWRIEKGGPSIEIPLGLVPGDAETAADTDPFESIAHGILASAFGDVFVESLGVAQVVKIGSFLIKGEWRPADTYIFAAQVERPFPRKLGNGEIFLMHWNKVPGLLKLGNYVTDANAVAMLSMATMKFKGT